MGVRHQIELLIRALLNIPWERRATELCLNEELAVEGVRGGVEGASWDAWVHKIGCSDRVAVEENISNAYEWLVVVVRTR